ncbi:MAG: A/G-specific adenine glycosylase [Crocinitomicaceae bacterium]|jgi:A/G-specific adenine glycosylase
MTNFSLLIADWYRQNHRSLPWRESNNAYFIWLSEIILQQTRVEQGTKYYLKFIANYPTVNDLANADEIEILNDWQGLGYYSRARNLHFSAKYIVNELNGNFPETYSEIIKLKGVGKYTAAAIASFAYDEETAVVDGNVYRLISRLFDVHTPMDSSKGQKEFQEIADQLIKGADPATHNQGMMEIGSTVCSPQPKCENCPLQAKCLAFDRGTIQLLPVKEKKTKVRDRYFHFFIFSNDEHTILEKRTQKDVWQNMYQFPLVETKKNPEEFPFDLSTEVHQSEQVKHILSHQHIYATFHHLKGIPTDLDDGWILVKQNEIQDYPLPRIIDRYLEETLNT